MKINSLLENITPSSSTSNTTTSAPVFGRDDEQLEETTAGCVASIASPIGGVKRRGKGDIFTGIKTSKKYPNTKLEEKTIDQGNLNDLDDYKKKQKLDYDTEEGLTASRKRKTDVDEAVTLDRSKNPNYPKDPATIKHQLDTAKLLLSDPKTDPDSRRAAAAFIAQHEKKGVAEDQLDELKCWTGYHRVKGTVAGSKGSCAKNESTLNEFDPGDSGDDDLSDRDRKLFKLIEIAKEIGRKNNVISMGMIPALNLMARDDYYSSAVEGLVPDITDKERTQILKIAYAELLHERNQRGVNEGDVNDFTHPNWAQDQSGIDDALKNFNDNQKAKPPNSESWMFRIKQQYPNVKFVQAKMPGSPIIALVNGKPVAQFDTTVKEFILPSAQLQDPELEKEKHVNVIIYGNVGKDWLAEDGWSALEELLPKEYPVGDGDHGHSRKAQEKVYEVTQKGGAVVTTKPLSMAQKLVQAFKAYGIKAKISQNESVNEAEISEEMLAHELYKDLQIFKKASDKTIGNKAKAKDLSSKPKDKEIIAKVVSKGN